MATINWIAATAKSFTDTTAWSGGVVPVAADNIVFDANGPGNCVFPSSVPCASLTVDGYIGTISGTTSSISTNGTVLINGKLSFTTQFTVSRTSTAGNTSDCEIGPDAEITTPRFSVVRGNLFGSLENIIGSRIDMTYNGSVAGTVRTTYFDTISTGGAATFTFKSGTRLECTLRPQKSGTTGANTTLIFEDDVQLFGDIRVTNSSSFAITPTGTLILAGTADQNLDCGGADVVSLTVQKTAGNVTTTAGTKLNIVDDSTCATFDNAGSITVAANVTLAADIVSRAGSSLIFDPTATLVTENVTRSVDHSDTLDVTNVRIVGSGAASVDLIGNVADIPLLVFDKIGGNTVVFVPSSGNETDVVLQTKGEIKGDIDFAGVGTVQLAGDLFFYELNHDDTIHIDENGFVMWSVKPHINTVVAYGFFTSLTIQSEMLTSAGNIINNSGEVIYDVNNIRYNAGATGAGSGSSIY